jgi:hypothetical protein
MEKQQLLDLVKNKDYLKMNKKELKDLVENHGFWTKSKVNKIDTNKAISSMRIKDKQKTYMTKTKEYLDWLDDETLNSFMYFDGVISQNYWVGEKSMNGYKIDQDGWDISKYTKLPSVYLQHDMEQPIWRSIYLSKDEDWNTVSRFYLDSRLMDELTKNRIQEEYITGISTGHITLDAMIEDEDGKLMTISDARDKDDEKTRKALYYWEWPRTYVVTEALLLEFSMVTMGSNEDALATRNIVGKETLNKFLSLRNNMENLHKNPEEEVITTEEVISTEEVVSEESENNDAEPTQEPVAEVQEEAQPETTDEVIEDTQWEQSSWNAEEAPTTETNLAEKVQVLEQNQELFVKLMWSMTNQINSLQTQLKTISDTNEVVSLKNELLTKKVSKMPVVNKVHTPNSFGSETLAKLAEQIG